jgi:hypothetical protein
MKLYLIVMKCKNYSKFEFIVTAESPEHAENLIKFKHFDTDTSSWCWPMVSINSIKELIIGEADIIHEFSYIE